jgi:threonine synthase
VTAAIGREVSPPFSLQGLMDKEARCAVLDAKVEAVKDHIRTTLEARRVGGTT